MQFVYSAVPHKTSSVRQLTRHETTWEQWVSDVVSRGHDVRANKDGLMYSPCTWAEGATQRTENFSIDCGAIVIDIDGEKSDPLVGVQEIAAKLDARNISYLVHNTHSSTNEFPCFRVWAPLSRRVTAKDWERFWLAAMVYLRAIEHRDGNCKNVGRWYFMPAIQPNVAPVMFFKEGLAMNVDEVWATPVPVAVTVDAPKPTKPISKEMLKDLHKKIARKADKEELCHMLKLILDGEMIVDDTHGTRHAAFLRLTMQLAHYFPEVDPDEMGKLFGPTLANYSDQSRFTPEYVAGMFRTAQEKAHGERLQRLIDDQAAKQAKISQASSGKRQVSYREEEVINWGIAPTLQEMSHLWALQKSSAYFTLVEGSFNGPYTKDEAFVAFHRDLQAATDVGVELEVMTKTAIKRKSREDIVADHGTILNDVEYSYLVSKSVYSTERNTLTIASAPRSKLTPEFHSGVSQYLEVLGKDNHTRLLTWLAALPDLSRPLPILALIGAKGAAKSGLPHGLSMIWERGIPTSMEVAMSRFNAEMRFCPLLFADESLPSDNRGRPRTRELRRMVQERKREIEVKFLPKMTLVGCTRSIVSANSLSIIEGEDHLNDNDVEAIGERFLYIDVTKDVPEFVSKIGHLEFSSWITSGAVARHALWLQKNHKIEETNDRFLIAGGSSRIAHTMATGTALGAAVAEWVYNFLLDPNKLYNHHTMGGDVKYEWVFARNGDLFLSASTISEHYDVYGKGLSRPSMRNVARGLDSITTREYFNESLPISGKRTKFRKVLPEALEQWALNSGLDFNWAEMMMRAEAALNEKMKTVTKGAN